MDLERGYGISPSLLKSYMEPSVTLAEGDSSEADIHGVIELLAPKPCGVPLIRLGGTMDGGYLLPDDLDGIEACFSPGTNNFKRFEDELAHRYGIRSYLCDFSSDVERLQTPLISGMQFFQKKWLDVDGSSDAIDLDSWVADNTEASTDLLLQIDIEGAEFRNILAAGRETLDRFRMIIMEIHDLHRLTDRVFLQGMFLPFVRKLAANHLSVHVHANNACGECELFPGMRVPSAIEITFLRKDRLHEASGAISVPHVLDELNVLRDPPIALGGTWLDQCDPVSSRLAALEMSVRWLNTRVTSLMECNQFLLGRARLAGNLALDAEVSQSSTSAWSRENDARGGANGVVSGSFGFHTNIEARPWWMADLRSVQALGKCLIFNRMDGAAVRARSLQILTSEEGSAWTLRYDHSGKPVFGGLHPSDGMPPLLVDLGGVAARFVKLQLQEFTALHLDEIEIYAIPSMR